MAIPTFIEWMKLRKQNEMGMMPQMQMPQANAQMGLNVGVGPGAGGINPQAVRKMQADVNKEFMDKQAMHKRMAHARHCKKMKNFMRKNMGKFMNEK